jgi:hypothetical protein
MRIKVERTLQGFRLTDKYGNREYLSGRDWTRKLASQALDVYEYVYGYRRKTIRFLEA